MPHMQAIPAGKRVIPSFSHRIRIRIMQRRACGAANVGSARPQGAPQPTVENPIMMSGDLTAAPATPGIDGLPPELRRWAVAAIFTALALASLDTAIANIALPVGLAMPGIGMMLRATLRPEPGIANIVWRMVVCGIGFGFFQTPNLRALMSSAPSHRSGSASSMVATARLTGQTLGAGFAALGSAMSFLRLAVAPPQI
jgi:hypothetical protein